MVDWETLQPVVVVTGAVVSVMAVVFVWALVRIIRSADREVSAAAAAALNEIATAKREGRTLHSSRPARPSTTRPLQPVWELPVAPTDTDELPHT